MTIELIFISETGWDAIKFVGAACGLSVTALVFMAPLIIDSWKGERGD